MSDKQDSGHGEITASEQVVRADLLAVLRAAVERVRSQLADVAQQARLRKAEREAMALELRAKSAAIIAALETALPGVLSAEPPVAHDPLGPEPIAQLRRIGPLHVMVDGVTVELSLSMYDATPAAVVATFRELQAAFEKGAEEPHTPSDPERLMGETL